MASGYTGRSRSLQRTSYSNPPSRSGSRSRADTPIRSRSSSLEPLSYSFSKPLSRATSLQTLPTSTSPSSAFSSLPSRSPITPTLNRIKSTSLTSLSPASSFSPTFSYRSQPTFNTYNRYSSINTSIPRTSLVDIRRPPISDRYQPYGVGRYGGAPAIIPSYSRYQRSNSPAPALKYFGPTQYLSSYANQQGVNSYSKLLQYSFTGTKRSDRSSDTKPAIVSRNSYFEPGRYANTYRSVGSNYARSQENSPSTYGASMYSRKDTDSTDLYKTRFQPTGAMSKYWLTPRKLFTGREND